MTESPNLTNSRYFWYRTMGVVEADVASLMAVTRKRMARLQHQYTRSTSRKNQLLALQDDLTSHIFEWGNLAEAQADHVVAVSRALDELEEGGTAAAGGGATTTASVPSDATPPDTATTDHILLSELESRNQALEDKVQSIEQERSIMAEQVVSKQTKQRGNIAKSMANVKALREKLQRSVASLDSFKDDASHMHQEVLQLRDETSQQREMLAKVTALNHMLEDQVETLLYEQCLLKRELEDERCSSQGSSVASFDDLVVKTEMSFPDLVPREPIAVLLRDMNQSNGSTDEPPVIPDKLIVVQGQIANQGGGNETNDPVVPDKLVQGKIANSSRGDGQTICQASQRKALLGALSFNKI